MEKSLTLDWGTDELHEECGVFGMYDLDGNDVASTIYYGLFALQHRGQESCGIAVSDTYGPKGVVKMCIRDSDQAAPRGRYRDLLFRCDKGESGARLGSKENTR